MAKVPFTGEPFFPADLSVTATDVLIVAIGIPITAAVVARFALRRVEISPLGVRRHVPGRAPGGWRLVPLLVGICELAYFVGVGRPSTTSKQIQAYGAGFLLAMVGLLVAGPWLTMAGSRLMARRANHPTSLIAGRRLSDNPRAAFRSVSGLIIALFITTTAFGVITTIVGYHTASTGGTAGRNLIAEDFVSRPLGALSDGLVNRLADTPGVRGVVVVHTDSSNPGGQGLGLPAGLVACADLANIPARALRTGGEGGHHPVDLRRRRRQQPLVPRRKKRPPRRGDQLRPAAAASCPIVVRRYRRIRGSHRAGADGTRDIPPQEPGHHHPAEHT